MQKQINILGIRGLPAAHGGFETFAAHLAPYLLDNGWSVIVYCQTPEGSGIRDGTEDEWEGIRRVHFGSGMKGPLSTIDFDWKCTLDVLKRPGIDLVLGYNTAIFTILQRLWGRKVVMNMDGIEWKRAKWGRFAKIWFWLNEWIGSQTCNVPIADHPEIAGHLKIRGCDRSVVIPYGSNEITSAPDEPVKAMGLMPDNYFITIARIEPENSILEAVRAFSSKKRSARLVVLGNLSPANPYHNAVISAASADVIFPGAIYDGAALASLRYHCRAYIHGHQVGGTNPSLVEALGAGSVVIAHDNKFNRWVAGDGQYYFQSETVLCDIMETMLTMSDVELLAARKASLARHKAEFEFPMIHAAYERIFLKYL